jgi:hypothetical protein
VSIITEIRDIDLQYLRARQAAWIMGSVKGVNPWNTPFEVTSLSFENFGP